MPGKSHITLDATSVSSALEIPFPPYLEIALQTFVEWRISCWWKERACQQHCLAAPLSCSPGMEESSEAGSWRQPGSSAIKNKISQQRLQVSLNRTTPGHPTWPTLHQSLGSVLSCTGSETTASELCAENRLVSFWEETWICLQYL